ncbi:MAG TPA: GNAT family N-acetyltransferase [Candidatus Saccharimonadales bacterium]|nr:GNAT family N-acetyltransferase [Candidatus Saccharimonadales bacterium]
MGRPDPLTAERPEAQLTLRPATSGDEVLLLGWRNDPEAVRLSVTGREVTPAEHAAWLARRLGDPGTRLWIAEERGTPVGQVRVDLEGGSGTVSIAIGQGRRGHGLGSAALRAMVVEVERDQIASTLRALVHAENPASLRAFERAGFHQRSTRNGEFVVLERAVAANA